MNQETRKYFAEGGSVFVRHILALLCFAVAGTALAGDLMRIISPVRLSSEPGPALDQDVQKTRAVLARFQKGGFEYAVWAVDSLPAAETNIAAWTESCLRAFPGKPILALDIRLENGKVLPDEQHLKAFLTQALPAVDSVLLNYTNLNNLAAETQDVIEAVKANADLVRNISKNKPLWLYIDWEKEPAPAILAAWTNTFAGNVYGFFVQHSHGWDVKKHPVCAAAGKSLLSLGKPVIRAGFRYMSARSRPGIEEDMAENYRQRIGVYEKWMSNSGFAGCSRDTGGSIPEKINVNLDFIENQIERLRGTNAN